MDGMSYTEKKMQINKQRDDLYTRKRKIEGVYQQAINAQDDLGFYLCKMLERDIYLQNDGDIMYCYNTLRSKVNFMSEEYEEKRRYVGQVYKELENELDVQEYQCDRQRYEDETKEKIQ